MNEYLSMLSAEIMYLNNMINEEDEKENKKKIKQRGTQTNTKRLKKEKCNGVIARQHLLRKITPTQKPKGRRAVRFMDWKKYHRLSVIYAFMDDLEKDYPAICTVQEIGQSVEGRSIKMLKISNTNVNNTAVWLDACIHSREWISTAVVTYIANTIAKNFYFLPQSITNKDWYFVPVINPDGYEFTHTNERMWRKNRAKYEGKVVGVDLNRNFSCGWGKDGDKGSSSEPNNVFYRGPAPFSEPETVAVRDAIMNSRTPFKVFLSFHSYFELIIFPWGHIDDACPDYLNLLEGGAVMARAIYESSGMIYKVGSTKDLTYSACGTSTDWSYTIANIPFSYMIELRSKRHKFRLPRDQIIDTGKEIWSAVDKLMEFVDKK